ncbi:hypothetical protein HGI09_61240 [Streptomyces collinus]|nr:hypothetical protein HGI09_00020 [Streptomyces collinus]UJA18729.1 hypothetical protein HGI09_61240 [Streptomyces collinus]
MARAHGRRLPEPLVRGGQPAQPARSHVGRGRRAEPALPRPARRCLLRREPGACARSRPGDPGRAHGPVAPAVPARHPRGPHIEGRARRRAAPPGAAPSQPAPKRRPRSDLFVRATVLRCVPACRAHRRRRVLARARQDRHATCAGARPPRSARRPREVPAGRGRCDVRDGVSARPCPGLRGQRGVPHGADRDRDASGDQPRQPVGGGRRRVPSPAPRRASLRPPRRTVLERCGAGGARPPRRGTAEHRRFRCTAAPGVLGLLPQSGRGRGGRGPADREPRSRDRAGARRLRLGLGAVLRRVLSRAGPRFRGSDLCSWTCSTGAP